MAFMNKIGNLLKSSSTLRPLSQTIRCMSTSKLFIGGLSYNTSEEKLQEAFTPYGHVVEARIIIDRESNRSRGFGFVTYATSDDASAAITALDGQVLDGRTLRVSYAHDRGTKTQGYGGRDGWFGGGGNVASNGGYPNYSNNNGYDNSNRGYDNGGADGNVASNGGYPNYNNNGYDNSNRGYDNDGNVASNGGYPNYNNNNGYDNSNRGYGNGNGGYDNGDADAANFDDDVCDNRAQGRA